MPPSVRESKMFYILSGYLNKRPCWLRNVLLTKLKQDGHGGDYLPN